MCGIVGLASSTPIRDPHRLTAMRDTMRHRGPDDAGEWWSDDGCIGLGHRRLAIIDLSPSGHQPMRDADGDCWIVFNGEIYNFPDLRKILAAKGHSFRTRNDTEVILEAYREWGTECLARLNGMFAFALYDRRNRTLFLARDRAGEKPLFYSREGNRLRFASELKALMADPDQSRRINPEALDCILALGFTAGERCILQNVKKLPPAHAMTFQLETGELRVWPYWRLPEAEALPAADENSLLDELENILEDAVRRQLVADVPVGILLSGGVDSSLVTAMAVRSCPRVKTFTIRFPGHGVLDETEHARLIARHFGTEHVELEAEESTVDLLPLLARQFDEPIVDSSMIPTYLVSRLVREHCTVALGGDGGDELFAGYPHYSRLLWMRQAFDRLPLLMRRLISASAQALLPVGFRGRNWLQGLSVDWQHELPLTVSGFDRPTRKALMAGQDRWPLKAESIRAARIPRTPDLLARSTRMDFENYLPEDILAKVDRASMLTSLEVRAPLLDYRVIEFAFGRVPSPLKATTTDRKILLKKLAARLLPPEFDRHRKQGFSIPLGSWLQSKSWQDFFREVLTDTPSPLFNSRIVKDMLDGQARGRANGERLFALVLIELWRREYRVLI